MDFFDKVSEGQIVPVVVIDDARNAVPCAKALLEGGIVFMEITMRTTCALDAIKEVVSNVPGITVGAGTVLSVDNAKSAIACGASFIVSPGFSAEVADLCVAEGIPYVPGCVTPTEIMAAAAKGLNVVKFFPAKVYGGKSAVKELAGVFRNVKFLPTGGINTDNLEDYIGEPYIAAVGGSWVCPSDMISAGDFAGITARSREAKGKIKAVKEGRS
ncbi:MAG: bifunctional 4-hydroxy-2-oxoglutarate aldolase/2-dehydro-3-deoxy-phosphogluconate aldolase [Clostridiales bacterium]|nr:bifunctional 4-hydroxy-2-oxoglutarate aldolase/2-dehydro-3-deoxy-phosphogluconate aldolase [Clostridiales bacterium]